MEEVLGKLLTATGVVGLLALAAVFSEELCLIAQALP